MKLLVEDLNNKGNGTNLNRDEETEQSSLQMTNDKQPKQSVKNSVPPEH